MQVEISEQEVQSGEMTPANRDAAVDAVRRDGFVVLAGVIDCQHLETLRVKMQDDVEKFLARDDAPYNFNTSNVQQDPPPFPPYLFRDVLLNDMVIAVTKELLGSGVKNSYYSGNTALPSTQRQPVHPDVGHLWQDVLTPAFGLVVNVPVVEVTPENGGTELWPGSHLDTRMGIDQDIKIPEELLARRRKVAPPFQASIPLGGVLIRDIRLWHAGMPNRTRTPRPMIAMIHWCRWWDAGSPLLFPKGTETFFQHPRLHTNARFVDGPIDYVSVPQAYDFKK
jgi:hypothetical protein